MTTNTFEVYVDKIHTESPMVKSFLLKPTDKSSLPRFSGGAHLTTKIKSENETIERHYSLVSDPDQNAFYQIAVGRDTHSKGGSVYWHDKIKEGDRIEISYPRNHFPLSFQARHHIFIACGIGITPFLAMAKDLKKKGKSFELHYTTKSKDLCAFYPYLSTHFPNETTFYFSEIEGRMSPKIMENKPIGSHVYFCGNEGMIKQFTEAAKSYGYPEQNVHYELFQPPETGPMYPFEVKLNKSNQVIQIPENKTLLETLLENNVDAPHSCRIGGCGSCEVEVLQGQVDHRDMFLTDNEKKEKSVILTCVSRSKKENGCLVIDL